MHFFITKPPIHWRWLWVLSQDRIPINPLVDRAEYHINAAINMAIQHGQSPLQGGFHGVITIYDPSHGWPFCIFQHLESHGDWGSCILRNPQYQNDHLGTHTWVIVQWDHRFTTEKYHPNFSHMHMGLSENRVYSQ